jgi:hypothetical protein
MEDLAPGAVGWLGSTGGITEDGPKPARATPPATSPSWRYEIIASALELGGTVTGEHGVGLLKRDGLVAEITPAVLAMHHAVTAALDPYGISTPRQDLHHARAVTAPPLPTTRPCGVSCPRATWCLAQRLRSLRRQRDELAESGGWIGGTARHERFSGTPGWGAPSGRGWWHRVDPEPRSPVDVSTYRASCRSRSARHRLSRTSESLVNGPSSSSSRRTRCRIVL